ncbi:hypothetical protein KPH14_011053 [Odynerus spinipes]|uniref:G-protein coupled receptors family 1 profile domain-containing protein n=1 Tax=Odynerus spinipes TaxID=1348599 RepID=A0AAD9VLZ3_9HYME|nr:hypothetical protein KPH14_011053 [Odynerus spinipes]
MDGDAADIVEGTVADLGDLERWWKDPGIAVWSFILFGCFLLNATLFLAFLIRPGLRTISNRFVMNLTVSNLLISALLNPLLIMDASPSSKTSSSPLSAESVCAISEGATALMTTSSVLSVFLIAIDQYFAVVDPLRYRARVDKLKSGILIVSVWLVSSVFALLAFLNPNPRSLWLSCNLERLSTSVVDQTENTSTNSRIDSSFSIFENETAGLETFSSSNNKSGLIETFDIEERIEFVENSTIFLEVDAFVDNSNTYGMIYALVHSLFAYLLPFACVCWIYVKIYSAAHRNSERTRRTGSRPILSSASFCEDPRSQQQLQQQHQQLQQQADNLGDDFRRIPKISSLSSIDETSETTQPAGSQVPRRRSFSSASEILPSNLPCCEVAGEATSSSGAVVFTLGAETIEDPNDEENERNESNEAKLPVVSTLKAEFLEKNEPSTWPYDDLVKSRFLDRADQRVKSSHDLMYEQMLMRESTRGSWFTDSATGLPDLVDCSDSDSEGEVTSERFRPMIDVVVDDCARSEQNPMYLSPYSAAYETASNRNEGKNKVEVNVTSYVGQSSRVDERSDLGGGNIESELNEFERSKKRQRYDGLPSDFEITEVIVESCEVFDVQGTDRTTEIALTGASTETSACLLTPIVTITPAPNKSSLHRVASVRSTSSYINSLKYRISNGSLFRYREETRAARISALVIVMGLICWSPYEILLLLKNLPPYNDQRIAHEYDVTALCFLVLAAYVSPLLFGYRSKRVKRELRKFFCFKKELSYKNNRSLMAKKVLKRRHSSTFSHLEMDNRYNIFNCVYGRNRWPKEKVQFVQVPDTALVVETCRSSFSSGASTQISSTSTDDC